MKFTGALIAGLILIIGFVFSRCGGGGQSDIIDTLASPITPAVNRIPIADTYVKEKVHLKTRIFYRAHEYKRAWLRKRRPDKMYQAFVDEVKESARYGFSPEDYQIREIEQAVRQLYGNRKRNEADISNADIRITASFFLFTTHLIEGKVRYPGAKEFLWERGMPLENDIALLVRMESAKDLRKEMEDLHPRHPQYKRLQAALTEYKILQQSDTFPAISHLDLKPGESHPEIRLVRKKLQLTDYKGRRNETSTLYDDPLVEAVKRFQRRHGFEPDGLLDKETVDLLNTPLKQKTELIALNLERLRWHPHIRGENEEIVVNVPEYMLRVYRNNREKVKMRVVLGSEFTPTPVFHDTLKYVVFSPTWMVPRSIFEKEFLPRLRKDSFYYTPERFMFYKSGKEIDPTVEEWVDEDLDITQYAVIEKPGEANSLGNVKFIMPNDYSIYLHDTPADQLFSREQRALSHGCIRLEKPAELANYLLRDQKGWNDRKIQQAMRSGKPVKVDFEKTYPVYIVYRTVTVDDGGQVNFFRDVYGHDQRHLATMHNVLASK